MNDLRQAAQQALDMAREAGMPPVEIISDKPVLYPVPDAIERFANLVAAAEQDRCCRIVYGLCISDNNAQEIVNAIRRKG